MDLTCLAMHPNEDCIATGAANGKIILWYNYLACMRDQNKVNEERADDDDVEMIDSSLLNGVEQSETNSNSEADSDFASDSSSDSDMETNEKQQIRLKKKKKKPPPPPPQQQKPKKTMSELVNKPTKSILHWHSLPVISLRFTPEGSFLLSGGHECVLVKWLYKTGQKDFRPRLGSPIGQIVSSLDNTLYATRHLDNCELISFIPLDFYLLMFNLVLIKFFTFKSGSFAQCQFECDSDHCAIHLSQQQHNQR